MEDKQLIRREMRLLKEQMTLQEKEKAAQRIFGQLEKLIVFRHARSILVYHALPDEVPTASFIGQWAGRKTLLLPKVCGEILKIGMYIPDDLVKGSFGISEPQAAEIDPCTVDLVIVPGVAYDRQMNRLGRGKGYYDRLLAGISAPCIGICFDCQLVGRVPAESHDRPMDAVITPSVLIAREDFARKL